MFSSRSRYFKVPLDTVTLPDGREGAAVRFPIRGVPPLLGYHRRLDGQRLDHIANFYLQDPTSFWRLCDANQTISPDALASRELIGVPVKES
jgi:hypothetical protein